LCGFLDSVTLSVVYFANFKIFSTVDRLGLFDSLLKENASKPEIDFCDFLFEYEIKVCVFLFDVTEK